MSKPINKGQRVLAVAPCTPGFGYAVLEPEGRLVDWGLKTLKGDKNAESIKQIGKLIDYCRPAALILPDLEGGQSRRCPRIRRLAQDVKALASSRQVPIALVPREQVRRTFFIDGQGTRHTIAKIIAGRFSEELGFRLPPRRRPWMNEDRRMSMFDAVALALTFQSQRRPVK